MNENWSVSMNLAHQEEIEAFIFLDTEIWERLQREKSLYADGLDEDIPDFPIAYEWLKTQCGLRIPEYRGHFPWVTRVRDRSRRLPRMPAQKHSERKLMRLELRLPAAKTVRFPCNTWVAVMNRFYVGASAEEYERWSSELSARGIDDVGWPLPPPFHDAVIASWSTIFDLERLRQGGEYDVEDCCVAFEELNLYSVSAVTLFQEGRWRRKRVSFHPY